MIHWYVFKLGMYCVTDVKGKVLFWCFSALYYIQEWSVPTLVVHILCTKMATIAKSRKQLFWHSQVKIVKTNKFTALMFWLLPEHLKNMWLFHPFCTVLETCFCDKNPPFCLNYTCIWLTCSLIVQCNNMRAGV